MRRILNVLEVRAMPHNKSQTINSQENHDSVNESAITIKPNKASVRAPSLNGINKNNQT
jgi:hypothetical protein